MSRFDFPCGVSPGFDPSHIVAANTRFSGVAMGGNFVDLLTGRLGSVTGAPTANIREIIGPNVKFGGGTDNISITGKKSFGADAAPLGDTLAAIVILNSSASQQALLALGTSGTDTGYSYLSTTGANAIFGIGHQGATLLAASSWAGTLLVPIFIAASQSLSASVGATQTANLVAVRLDTGQTFANTASNSGYTAGSRNGTYNIGSRGASSLPSTANVAALMSSDRFAALSELLVWAADPWSFWYQP